MSIGELMSVCRDGEEDSLVAMNRSYETSTREIPK